MIWYFLYRVIATLSSVYLFKKTNYIVPTHYASKGQYTIREVKYSSDLTSTCSQIWIYDAVFSTKKGITLNCVILFYNFLLALNKVHFNKTLQKKSAVMKDTHVQKVNCKISQSCIFIPFVSLSALYCSSLMPQLMCELVKWGLN